MWESIRKMWKIPELRNKILYTLGMLLLFRLVGVIPAPGVDAARVLTGTATDLPILQLVNMMTGSNFANMTIMAMGITPYINASIIMQLLTIAIPALERMQRDEEGGGREKIAQHYPLCHRWPGRGAGHRLWWPWAWALPSTSGWFNYCDWWASAWLAVPPWPCGLASASAKRAWVTASAC